MARIVLFLILTAMLTKAATVYENGMHNILEIIKLEETSLSELSKICLVGPEELRKEIIHIKSTFTTVDEFEAGRQATYLREVLRSLYDFKLYKFLLTQRVPKISDIQPVEILDVLEMHNDSNNYRHFDPLLFHDSEKLYSAYVHISQTYSGVINLPYYEKFRKLIRRDDFLSILFNDSHFYQAVGNYPMSMHIDKSLGTLTDSILATQLKFMALFPDSQVKKTFFPCSEGEIRYLIRFSYNIEKYLYKRLMPILKKREKSANFDIEKYPLEKKLLLNYDLYLFFDALQQFYICNEGKSFKRLDKILMHIRDLREI